MVIEDGNGCQINGIETIGSTGGATITSTNSFDPLCFGDNSGSISVIASGGTGSLQYSIDGGTTFQSSATFNNLSGGSYTILVEDDNGCQTFTTVIIIEPADLLSIISIVEATCGTANGSATVTSGGGTGAISFQWDLSLIHI